MTITHQPLTLPILYFQVNSVYMKVAIKTVVSVNQLITLITNMFLLLFAAIIRKCIVKTNTELTIIIVYTACY